MSALLVPLQDNAELFAEEVERTVVEQISTRQAHLAAIPGMVPPNELPADMGD